MLIYGNCEGAAKLLYNKGGGFMIFMKRCIFFIFLSLLVVLPLIQQSAHAGAEGSAVYPVMSEPGKKVQIGNGYYLVYGFDKQPKLGTIIMKVEIFTKEGKKDTSFEVKADADMPSMRGAHGTGGRPFVLSKKGDYLLPINIVMPGDWEIKLTVMKDGKVFARGKYNFNV
jgi:hypothetical protein